jgi:hypothetical protein
MKNEPHFQALIYKFVTDFRMYHAEKSNARMKIDAAWVSNVPSFEKIFNIFFG